MIFAQCKVNFQGDKCRLLLNHDGDHRSPLHTWNALTKKDGLKPTIRQRVGRPTKNTSSRFEKFVDKCCKYNAKVGNIVPPKSTASIVMRGA